MLALFIVTTIVLAIVLVFMLRVLDEANDRGTFWKEQWLKLLDENVEQAMDLQGLEIGTKEIEENYQQELLDEYDKVKALVNSNAYWEHMANQLEEIRTDHEVYCLPYVGDPILDMNEDEPTPIFDMVMDRRQPVLF